MPPTFKVVIWKNLFQTWNGVQSHPVFKLVSCKSSKTTCYLMRYATDTLGGFHGIHDVLHLCHVLVSNQLFFIKISFTKCFAVLKNRLCIGCCSSLKFENRLSKAIKMTFLQVFLLLQSQSIQVLMETPWPCTNWDRLSSRKFWRS